MPANISAQAYRGMLKEIGAEDREQEPVGDTALGQPTHSEDVPGFRVRQTWSKPHSATE